ncbi:hypothetical protein DIPPA_25365 [Diplonema papillatum]|nr:hypothetical protein DIPPA_25365 [Diplonema papillatum]
MAKTLQQVLEAYRRDQESQARMRLIKKKSEDIVRLCGLLQEDVNMYFDEGIERLPEQEVPTALEAAYRSLETVFLARKAEFDACLKKRRKLVADIGDSYTYFSPADPHVSPDGYYQFGDATLCISHDNLFLLNKDISDMLALREDRRRIVRGLCESIAAFLVNENIPQEKIDHAVQSFLRTNDYARMGISADRIRQLVDRKEELKRLQAEQEEYQQDVRKKLRLIEAPRPPGFEAIAGPETFAAVGGERWFRALQYWLDGMCWSVAGDVSMAELAVDFEVCTKLDLPGSVVATTDGTPLSMRARVLAKLLKPVGDALERNGDGPLLPDRKLEKIGSLRTVGAPPCLTGYEMRPIFRGSTETMEVLETQLTTARVQRRGVGDGSFPYVRRWKGRACGEMGGVQRYGTRKVE